MNQTLYLCFIDFQRTFDQIKHDKLIKILQEIDIDKKDLKIITEPYWNQEIMMLKDEKEKVPIKKGVRQGCIISPILFNSYSEFLMKQVEKENLGININGSYINIR